MLEPLERRRNETAREYVIRVLQHNIINLNLKPGQLVSEKEIAEILGVSRTPVREAFIELSRSSMVEIYPQKGTYISLIDMEMVEESRFMRCVLEKAIVKLACKMISEPFLVALEENLQLQDSCVSRSDYKRLLALDNSFHELLFKACKKEATFNLIQSMMSHFNRVRILNLAEMDMQRTVNDHKEILQAIRDKDEEAAAALMEKHLTRVIFDQTYLKEIHPEYFK
ncbi:GntR family transcriptional regulator [Thermoanaerobacterium sp. DL9XJH110]|uniref:GntR family transcriptional regulator n=1 Tax=Thermoanaerobacterium sp. DL9XJH110 TaxID=3386643 RepID=UPI003BB800E8